MAKPFPSGLNAIALGSRFSRNPLDRSSCFKLQSFTFLSSDPTASQPPAPLIATAFTKPLARKLFLCLFARRSQILAVRSAPPEASDCSSRLKLSAVTPAA